MRPHLSRNHSESGEGRRKGVMERERETKRERGRERERERGPVMSGEAL